MVAPPRRPFFHFDPSALTSRVNGISLLTLESKKEMVRFTTDDTDKGSGGESAYPKKGKYRIAVKVIDIFGNDTTKVVEVTV